MKRSEIRYAISRVVQGNDPQPEHLEVFAKYEGTLKEYGLDPKAFMYEWDVDKKNPDNIVSGHMVHMYRAEHEPKGPEYNRTRPHTL